MYSWVPLFSPRFRGCDSNMKTLPFFVFSLRGACGWPRVCEPCIGALGPLVTLWFSLEVVLNASTQDPGSVPLVYSHPFPKNVGAHFLLYVHEVDGPIVSAGRSSATDPNLWICWRITWSVMGTILVLNPDEHNNTTLKHFRVGNPCKSTHFVVASILTCNKYWAWKGTVTTFMSSGCDTYPMFTKNVV